MNKEILVKTDQHGHYYPRISYNHDAEVKVGRDETGRASEKPNYSQAKPVEPESVRIL